MEIIELRLFRRHCRNMRRWNGCLEKALEERLVKASIMLSQGNISVPMFPSIYFLTHTTLFYVLHIFVYCTFCNYCLSWPVAYILRHNIHILLRRISRLSQVNNVSPNCPAGSSGSSSFLSSQWPYVHG